MRPLKLVMSAFGPYSDRVEIPMEKLGDSGIYLITGATGAGKTTIFDAIVFALYGEASGETRDAKMLRCKEALPTTPSFVELCFRLGDKDYTLKRNPEYQREAKRGGGITTEAAGAELVYPTGESVAGVKNVSAAVTELLGLNRNQFARTVMIAQGDFLKLLLAETTERRSIFRRIFSTENCESLQRRIKEDYLEEKRRFDSCREGAEQLNSRLEQQVSLEELPSALLALASKLEAGYQEAKLKGQGLEKEHAGLLSQAERETAFQALTLEAQKLGERLEELKKQNQELERKAKSLPRVQERIEELTIKINSMAQRLEQLRREDKLWAEKRREYSLLAKRLNTAGSEKSAAQKQQEDIVKRLEGLTDLELQSQQNSTALKACEELKEQLLLLQQAVEEYVKLREQHKKAKLQLSGQQEAYSHCVHKATEAELLFFSSQAGLLAARLFAGEPCPVCGAKEHPAPAKAVDAAPDRQELEVLRNKAELSRMEMEKQAGLCREIAVRKEERKKQSLQRVEQLLGGIAMEEVRPTIALRLEEAERKGQELEKQATEIKALLVERETLNAKLPLIKSALQQAAQLEEELGRSLAGVEAEGKAAANRVQELLLELKAESSAAAMAEADKMKEQLERAVRAKESLSQAVMESQRAIGKLTATKEAVEEQMKNAPEFKPGAAEAVKEIKAKLDICREEEKKLFSQLEKGQEQARQGEKLIQRLKKSEERCAWLQALSDTAGGNVRGRQRINFETYVQMSYFEMVIRAANTRLEAMSQGRYELLRKEEPDSLQSQSGLELNVLDLYSGSVRSVKTLSGGESFQAALAMALGLADVIQSHSGGIRMEALFVDEGFGSLDAESLDLAVNTLSQLSGRLVGIISHVAQLGERIDKKILVDLQGHQVRIEL